MKQKISSSTSINDAISFNASNPYICDTEDLSCPHDLCTEEWENIMSHMGNIYPYAQCQYLVSSIEDHIDLSHADLICEVCGTLLFDYEEPFIEEYSPLMHIVIRLSCPDKKNIVEKTDILKNQIEKTNNDIENLQGEVAGLKNLLQRCCEEFSSLKTICQQQNVRINKLESNQNASEQKYKEIEQQMEDYHNTSYDGTFTWKITNCQNKFEESRSGQQTSFFSPIFYSSPNGYKMRAQLYLYGDDTAAGAHMSVCLAILKGNYDNILTWPFNYQVNFCLFDQTGQNYHITDTTSATSQNPPSNMNIVGGISKFCPLALVEGQENHYVQDDTMFIKIMVDFLGTPRPLVPYTMSLNPELPTHIIEAQCQIEMENYKQLREQMVATMNQEDQNLARSALVQMHPPAAINRQPSPSTANLESMACEDLSND